MNTEDRPATRDTDSPYPREGLELVVPEEPAPRMCGVEFRPQTRPADTFYCELARGHGGRHGYPEVDLWAAPRRLPGWLARLVGR